MARTRDKAKGRRGGEGEHFARIPVSVLESEAVQTLPHAAFKVLVCLAAGYRGGNNGTLALTDTFARRFGLNSRDTLYRSLTELLERGLIVKTREGWRSKTHFALYALNWSPINHREGQPLDTPEMPQISRWLKWKAPDHSRPSDMKGKNLLSDGRTQSFPVSGQDRPGSFPIVSTGMPKSFPMAGNTLRYLAGDQHSTSSAKVLKLMRELPHLGDQDVSKITGAPLEIVQRVRANA